MSVVENKAVLREGADAFNNRHDRSGWMAIHDASVLAHGLGPVPPTGKDVRFGAQYIFRLRQGKIVERWTNLDRLGVLVQLGAVPAPV